MVITMLMSLEMEGVCFYTYTYTNIHVRVCTSVFIYPVTKSIRLQIRWKFPKICAKEMFFPQQGSPFAFPETITISETVFGALVTPPILSII